MTSKERTLWNAAVALVDSNASLAIVGVLHPLEHSEVILEERQIEIEAPTNTKHHLTCGSPQALTPGGQVYGHSSSHIPPLLAGSARESTRRTAVASESRPSPCLYKNTERPGVVLPARSRRKPGAGRRDSTRGQESPSRSNLYPRPHPKTPRRVKGA